MTRLLLTMLLTLLSVGKVEIEKKTDIIRCFSNGYICTYAKGQLVDKVEVALLMAQIDNDKNLSIEQKTKKRLEIIDIIKNHPCN